MKLSYWSAARENRLLVHVTKGGIVSRMIEEVFGCKVLPTLGFLETLHVESRLDREIVWNVYRQYRHVVVLSDIDLAGLRLGLRLLKQSGKDGVPGVELMVSKRILDQALAAPRYLMPLTATQGARFGEFVKREKPQLESIGYSALRSMIRRRASLHVEGMFLDPIRRAFFGRVHELVREHAS